MVTQILMAVALIGLGFFCVSAGILMMVNKKVRNQFAHWWWYYLENTDAGKKNAENNVKFFNAPLVIFAGLMSLYGALIVLNLLPSGW